MKTTEDSLEKIRRALMAVQDSIRNEVLAACRGASGESLQSVSAVAASDTIYGIDKVSEEALLGWFAREWPGEEPVELVAEGLEERGPITFPAGTPVADTRWKCIVDPIDGTRNIMYDKRSAWALAGVAPQRGERTCLADIVVAAMTELPTTKQWRSDRLSAVRGRGFWAESLNVLSGEKSPLVLRPSGAKNFHHGFASLARFFPAGKSLTARIEERLWEELYGAEATGGLPIFDDQYISSGGQFYELIAGHDRMLGDLRPLVHARLGLVSALECHPYDVCTELILREAGGIVSQPDGAPLDAPLDTVSPVAWIGFANAELAAVMRPVLDRVLPEVLG